MDIASELIGRAHALQPVLAERAAATEANRAPLDETVRDICEAGFVEMLIPKRFGGHELDLATACEVVRILGTACASTSWVTAFYIGHNWQNVLFPEAFRQEVFANGPRVLAASQIAPTIKAKRVSGGYEISGKSAWSSGVPHADWILMTGLLFEDGGNPTPIMFAVPKQDVTVVDTWFIAGMEGTGSMDVVVEGVFVPEHRTLPLALMAGGMREGLKPETNPLYFYSPLMALGYITVSVLTGMLRGATDLYVKATKDRLASYTGASVAAKPAAQMRIGRVVALAEAVEALLKDGIASMAKFTPNSPAGPQDRAQMKMRAALITKLARDGINDIMEGAGGNAFRNDAPLQRFFRDVNVLRTHAALDIEPGSEVYGRLLLGMDPGVHI